MNLDDFPIEKISVLPVSFERNQANQTPGYIISDNGEVYFTFCKIRNQRSSSNPDDTIIDHLVLERGFIHLWPIGGSLFISLQPNLVNLTSMTAAFYVIACFRPERVFISTEAENPGWELFSSGQRAMIRIERLVTASAKVSQPASDRAECPPSSKPEP